MNRGDLVDLMSKKAKISKRQADEILGTVIEGIQEGVRKEGEVRLVGFGTFKKAVRKARTGRNPKTGEKLKIKQKTYPKFVASKTWQPAAATRKAARKTKA